MSQSPRPALALLVAILAAGPTVPALAGDCCAVMPMLGPGSGPAPGYPGASPPMAVPISPLVGAFPAPPPAPPPPAGPGGGGAAAMPASAMPGAPMAGMAGAGAAGLPVARGTYTVQKGARLIAVAQRTGTRFSDLLLLNPDLPIDRKLPAGTRVLLPVAGSW